MKRAKRLTKKEQKALRPQPAGGVSGGHAHDLHHHIHCTACGRHLDEEQFELQPPSALWLRCDHGSEFPSCGDCAGKTRELLEEHDRTGQPVKHVAAWH